MKEYTSCTYACIIVRDQNIWLHTQVTAGRERNPTLTSSCLVEKKPTWAIETPLKCDNS